MLQRDPRNCPDPEFPGTGLGGEGAAGEVEQAETGPSALNTQGGNRETYPT